MTLIKSILMGLAAGIVAVASAQAADLPTKKAAPVEYVKVCNVGGITGWTLPGIRHLREVLRLHHRAVRRRQPQHPVQLRVDWRSRLRRPRILSFRRILPWLLLWRAFLVSTLHDLAGPPSGQRRSKQHDLQPQ